MEFYGSTSSGAGAYVMGTTSESVFSEDSQSKCSEESDNGQWFILVCVLNIGILINW